VTQAAISRIQVKPWRRPAPPADPSTGFADYVLGQLDGPVLRYSRRLALLKEAQRRGVGRFEANLMIASVLHRAGMGQECEMRPRVEWVAPVLTVLFVQSTLLLGAWWILL
jgi:hypothetical protein